MDKDLLTPLRAFVEAYATQNTENADALIHEYLCKKSQKMLVGEADDSEESDDKDDESKDEDDKDEDKKDKKSDDKDDESKDEDDKDED
jgi:hypothetical protein